MMWVRGAFWLSAIYYVVIGLAFLVLGVSGFWIPFAFADVGFLVLFSAAFVAIGKRPAETHGAGAWG